MESKMHTRDLKNETLEDRMKKMCLSSEEEIHGNTLKNVRRSITKKEMRTALL